MVSRFRVVVGMAAALSPHIGIKKALAPALSAHIFTKASDHSVAAEKLGITEKDLSSEVSLQRLYDKWLLEFHPIRRMDDSERAKRFELLRKMVKFIDIEIKKGHSYTLGLIQFTANTKVEWERMKGLMLEGCLYSKKPFQRRKTH